MSGKRARITDFYSRNSRPRVATGPGGGRRGPGGRITTINPNKLVLRARNMLRSYASRTMTMQQRKRRNVTKLSDGLTTVSSFRKGYRLKPFLLPLLKTAAPQYQVIRFGRRLSSGINAYGTDHMNFLDTGFFEQIYRELIPNNLYNNQRVFVESIKFCVEFCNSGDQIMNLELYDIACKKDGTQDPQSAMTQGFSTLSANTNFGNSANVAVNVTSLGFTPYNSPQLGQLYSIEKCTKTAIPSGHIHKHYITFSPRMIMNETRRATGSNFFGGLTRHLLYRTRGQPVTQVDNPNVVGVGPSSVDIICIARAKLKYVAANRQTAWQFAGVDLGLYERGT